MFSDEEEGALGQPLQFALFNLFTFAWLFTFLSDFSLTFPDFFSRTAGSWLHRSHPERPDEAAAVQLDRGLSSQPYLLTVPFDRDNHHDNHHDCHHDEILRSKIQTTKDTLAQVLIFSLVPETLTLTTHTTLLSLFVCCLFVDCVDFQVLTLTLVYRSLPKLGSLKFATDFSLSQVHIITSTLSSMFTIVSS